MNVGHIVGLRGLPLLYWVRFLNIGLQPLWFGLASPQQDRHSEQSISAARSRDIARGLAAERVLNSG